MTRVLLAIDSLGFGGAERSTAELVPHLVGRGLEVEVAVLHDRPGLREQVEAAGVVVHDVSGRSRRAWFGNLRSLIESRRPDLVHTSLFEADVSGRLAAFTRRVPAVSTLATEAYGDDHLQSPQLDRKRVRAAQVVDAATARLAVRLHAVSEHVADSMAQNLRYPRRRIDVIHRGRSDHRPRADLDVVDLRAQLGFSAEQPIALVVARQERVKGIDRVLDALPIVLETLPSLGVAVAGAAGEHSEQLRDQVGRLGLERSVAFLGARSDVADLHEASDVFVLASRREGLPGSLIEAMAAETPAVVADLPMVREVAGPGEALIVDAGDPRALASAVVRAVCDADESATMARRARRRFLAEFTIEKSADRMLAFYERALGRPMASA